MYFNRIEFNVRQEKDNKSKITNRSSVCLERYNNDFTFTYSDTERHTSMHKSTRWKQSNILNQLVSQPTKTYDK